MILVDTTVWVDHLRAGDTTLARQLDSGSILTHPFVIGELALGNLRQRSLILSTMQDLPRVLIATDEEVLHFIDEHALFGAGLGYVDAHLLVAVKLTAGAVLWTRDKRLHDAADRLALAADLPR